MTDKEAIFNDGRKVTFAYERKVNLGNYENEGVSLYMTDFVPEGEDIASWVAGQAEPAFNVIKSLVWEALGLEMRFDEHGKPELVDYKPEVMTPPGGASMAWGNNPSAVNQMPAGSPPPQQAPTQQFSPPPIQQNQGGDPPAVAQPGYYGDMPTFCGECGERDFYDNRADNDTKIQQGKRIGPDFKCKNCKKAPNKSAWRPGSYDYNQKAASSAAPQAAPQMPPPAAYDPAVEGEPFN